jgi:hypothetical protein
VPANPSGIALSIAEACREICEHETSATKALCHDSAIRLMVYQVAAICDVASYSPERYIANEAACKDRLAKLGLRPFGAG